MLFHSSIRKELARSFGATLVVLFTIVLTMLLIRTLGMATKGSVNPEEIMLVLGYTVIGRMPTILTLALFISIVSTLSRMYRDSEMIIWLSSGRSLGAFIGPVMRFSWPVLLVIALSVFFVWPWSNQQTEDLRGRFENRGDLERVAPGQFQESSDGRRVFFIDKDTADGKEGRNIFIATTEEDGRETVTSARTGRIVWENGQQILMLNNGQRLETAADGKSLRVSEFESYGTQIGSSKLSGAGSQSTKSIPSWALLKERSRLNLAELGWRLGMALTALNFVLIAVATTTGNPRAGRGGNLFFTLFAFVFYYNLLNMGQSWVSSGSIGLGTYLVGLHGLVFVMTTLWMVKRHQNLFVRDLLRGLTNKPTAVSGGGRHENNSTPHLRGNCCRSGVCPAGLPGAFFLFRFPRRAACAGQVVCVGRQPGLRPATCPALRVAAHAQPHLRVDAHRRADRIGVRPGPHGTGVRIHHPANQWPWALACAAHAHGSGSGVCDVHFRHG